MSLLWASKCNVFGQPHLSQPDGFVYKLSKVCVNIKDQKIQFAWRISSAFKIDCLQVEIGPIRAALFKLLSPALCNSSHRSPVPLCVYFTVSLTICFSIKSFQKGFMHQGARSSE